MRLRSEGWEYLGAFLFVGGERCNEVKRIFGSILAGSWLVSEVKRSVGSSLSTFNGLAFGMHSIIAWILFRKEINRLRATVVIGLLLWIAARCSGCSSYEMSLRYQPTYREKLKATLSVCLVQPFFRS